ncbi:MAG: helix-turn-helix domain-containing protein [Faecousia sp.]
MEIDYARLGRRIANRRKEKGQRQNALAQKIGISNNHLSSIECGKERPSLEVLISICNALEVTPDYLLMGNMHSSHVPQSIIEGLQLCTREDVSLISGIVKLLIERQSESWNHDNFI